MLTRGTQDKHFEVTPKTTFQEVYSVLKEDARTANIQPDILELIFQRVSVHLPLTIFDSGRNLPLLGVSFPC